MNAQWRRRRHSTPPQGMFWEASWRAWRAAGWQCGDPPVQNVVQNVVCGRWGGMGRQSGRHRQAREPCREDRLEPAQTADSPRPSCTGSIHGPPSAGTCSSGRGSHPGAALGPRERRRQ